MNGSTAPTISITKNGEAPAVDIARLIARYGRVKEVLKKDTLKDFRRAELEEELEKLKTKIEPLKEALKDL